jgi:hypothetical protein
MSQGRSSFDVSDCALDAIPVVSKHCYSVIAAPTQQPAYLARFVTVINAQRLELSAAYLALALAPAIQTLILLWSDPVSHPQVVLPFLLPF